MSLVQPFIREQSERSDLAGSECRGAKPMWIHNAHGLPAPDNARRRAIELRLLQSLPVRPCRRVDSAIFFCRRRSFERGPAWAGDGSGAQRVCWRGGEGRRGNGRAGVEARVKAAVGRARAEDAESRTEVEKRRNERGVERGRCWCSTSPADPGGIGYHARITCCKRPRLSCPFLP